MKNRIILLLAAIVAFSSCDNELHLVAPWKRIPVVYGFLNLSENAQYIRVEKAFLDPEKSAEQIAKNPDSLYFNNIEVSLTRVKNGTTWLLTRVNGTDEGFPKKPGTFAQDPNYLYKINTKDIELVAGEQYKLSIKDLSNNTTIAEATTNVVGNYNMVATDPPNPGAWPYKSDVRFSWRSNETVGKVYDVFMKFYYNENTIDQPSKFAKKSLTWKIAENVQRPADPTSRITAMLKGEEIFKFLGEYISKIPGIKRIFLSYDVTVVAGGQEFQDYIDLGNASSGITSSQILPTYSNISNDGIGIFSSRNILEAVDYSINTPTRDSLKSGIYTKDLGFQ